MIKRFDGLMRPSSSGCVCAVDLALIWPCRHLKRNTDKQDFEKQAPKPCTAVAESS